MTEADDGKRLQSQVRKLAVLRGGHSSCGLVVRATNVRFTVPRGRYF